MQLARGILRKDMDMIVYVHLDSMAFIASWIIDRANQTLAGTRVSFCCPLLIIEIFDTDRSFLIGKCHEVGNSSFRCVCQVGWEGTHCQMEENYCHNATCQNRGSCRSLFRSYRCECLGHSYSGDHCEITAWKIVINQMVSKSFGYVAIIAISAVVVFIVVMDALKYGLGIDPVERERELHRQERRAKRRRPPVIEQFIYVNKPTTPRPSSKQIPDVEQIVV